MDIQEYKGVFIFVQQVDNKIASVSFELLGKAKELAKDLETEVTAGGVAGVIVVRGAHRLRGAHLLLR